MIRRNGWLARAPALAAAGGGIGYAVSKIHYAVTDRLGLPGFPAPSSNYRSISDVTLAQQLGNAGVGLACAALALLLLWPIRTRTWRVVIQLISWLALVVLAAGWTAFALRASSLTGGTDAAGETPAAQLVLLAGAFWVLSWAVALWLHFSAGRRPQ